MYFRLNLNRQCVVSSFYHFIRVEEVSLPCKVNPPSRCSWCSSSCQRRKACCASIYSSDGLPRSLFTRLKATSSTPTTFEQFLALQQLEYAELLVRRRLFVTRDKWRRVSAWVFAMRTSSSVSRTKNISRTSFVHELRQRQSQLYWLRPVPNTPVWQHCHWRA